MSTASTNRGRPTRSPRRSLPAFYQDYKQRFGGGDSEPVKERVPLRVRWEWFCAWIRSPDGRAFGASALGHSLLLICLSFVAFKIDQHKEAVGVTMGSGVGEGEGDGFETVLDGGYESAGGGNQVEFDLPNAAAAAAAAPALQHDAIRGEADLAATLSGLDATSMSIEHLPGLQGVIDGDGGVGTGKGGGAGPGMHGGIGNLAEGFSKPGGGRSVRKGKFTAWTVPTDPKPYQSYLIVIEVAWPKTSDKRQLRARKTDLTGTVVGSDNYFQSIEKSGVFIPKSNQMVIPVPGAEQYVQDVINVRSKLLNESQELTITF